MNKNIALTISVLVISFVLGLMTGYYITPDYQQNMFTKEDMGFGSPGKYLDLQYINKMTAHHRAAILLADQAAEKSQREEIINLAKNIQSDEPKLIAELYSWKKAWYRDSRNVKDPNVVNLGQADDKFDLRFLNALIAHHEEGIEMTKEIKTKSTRTEVLNNADSAETFLTTTLITLKGWREEWYGVK